MVPLAECSLCMHGDLDLSTGTHVKASQGIVVHACKSYSEEMETDREIARAHGKLPGQRETLLKEDKVKATETDTSINLWLPWVPMHVHKCAYMCTHTHRHKTHQASQALTELQWVQHST